MRDNDLRCNKKTIFNDNYFNKVIQKSYFTYDEKYYIKIYDKNICNEDSYRYLSDEELSAIIDIALKDSVVDTTNLEIIYTKEITTNPTVQKLFNSIPLTKEKEYFRGWILPNGQMISLIDLETRRQDYGAFVRLFMSGLLKYDKELYEKMLVLYQEYKSKNNNIRNIDENFAIDVLCWIQVSELGKKRIIFHGENWQNRLIAPFIIDYGFKLRVSENASKWDCYNSLFTDIYQNVDEIIKLALDKMHSNEQENKTTR